MAKKKLKLSIVELVWYPICALVMLWGIVYVVLGLINKYNDLSSLDTFCKGFKSMFKLDIYFWGLIIFAIAVVAAVVVALYFAKTYDKVADREQRRSARLNALKKPEKVVDEQEPQFTTEAAPAVEEQPKVEEEVKVEVTAPVEEPIKEEEIKAEEPELVEAPVEEKAE